MGLKESEPTSLAEVKNRAEALASWFLKIEREENYKKAVKKIDDTTSEAHFLNFNFKTKKEFRLKYRVVEPDPVTREIDFWLRERNTPVSDGVLYDQEGYWESHVSIVLAEPGSARETSYEVEELKNGKMVLIKGDSSIRAAHKLLDRAGFDSLHRQYSASLST